MAFEKYEIANKPRYLLKNNKMKIIEVGLFALSTDQRMPIQRIESSYLHFHCSPKMLLKKRYDVSYTNLRSKNLSVHEIL